MDPEHALIEFAAAHRGLALTSVFREAGGTRDGLWRLLRQGRWARVSMAVIRSTAAPITEHQQALAAVLDSGPGSALTNESGTALWKVPGFDLLPAQVLRPRMSNRSGARLGQAHWATLLPDELVTTYEGITVVRPAYLALLLFGSIDPRRAQRAVATMLASRLTTVGALERVLDQMAVQGRNGIVALRTFVTEERRRGQRYDSGLERRFDGLLEAAGQRRMRAQVDIGDDDGWIGRVDFVDEDVPLIVEIDSERHHASMIDEAADLRRTAQLEAAGYTVKRFTDTEVWHHGDQVVAEVRRLRARLRRAAA